MSRVTTLVNLYKTAVQEYTKSPDEWKGLLSAIARYYKRSFDNAVLVYAQRPDFTQLATFDEWHDSRINRSINKGAKGIAVIDMSNPGASFKYLFDFMDTNGTEESFRAVLKYHWELEEQYHQGVIQNFHKRYGTSLDSMESCLSDFVKTKVSQGLADMKGFQVTDESSILYGMPIEAVKAEFIDLLTNSVLYAVFYKCNIPTEFLGDDSFQNIGHFNGMELFMALGNDTVSITRGVLKEVYQQIEAIKQERSAAHEKRTVNPITVSGESGRDDDSRLTDIIRSGDRPSSNREIRPAVETVHDGEPSPAVESVDRGGDDQRDDYQGGQRGRDGERNPDSSTAERITNAGSGRDNEPDSPYESDYNDSRGNRHEHDYISQSITEQNHDTKPPIEPGDSKPSIGGFFVVPPRQTEKVEHAEESVQELVPDTQKDDIPEEELSVQVQVESPDMDNALPDRLQMVDEEHFEFVDEFLNSTDWIPMSKWRSWREFLVAINDGYYDSEARNKDIQEFYDTLNIDYMLLGEEIHIDGREDGLVFTIDNQQLLVAYDVVRKRLESLILQGDIKELDQESFDEYAIPDEPESMTPDSAGRNGESGYLGTYQINLFDAFGADDDTDMDAEIQVEEMEPVQEESTQEKLSEPSVLPIHEYDDNQGEIEMLEPKSHKESEEFGVPYSNYRFSEEHHLYDGGVKTKCRNNIAAIRLLKELQEQGRNANEEEQIILARFVGWGGLANALTPGKSGWESEYEEIHSLLSEEEFLSAQQSTITAYYTEQMIVGQMYAALEKFGFNRGNILDPAMGTGNFYSVLPESMQESRLYGVELDTISGVIAKQLYPGAEIQVKGYEYCNYPDQFFDVVIGNFPFNSVKINDRKYDRHNFRIHEYFFAKSFDQIRPGGIVAAITSKYMMDKANSSVRKYIAQRAELMGAIRLPNTAFKAVAGTEVTSDILFFKKREREVVPDDQNSPWLYIEENEDGIPMNRYFLDHPEMVLGTMVFDESMFGNEKTTACHPDPEDDLAERLERAVYYLEGSYEEADSEYADERTALEETLPADPNVRNFSYVVVDDAIYFQEHSRMYKQDISGKKAERIKGMVELTGLVRDLIAFQADTNYAGRDLTTEEFEEGLQSRLKELNQTYDRFVASNGPVNNRTNVSAFSRDSNAPLLRSIEQENKQQKGEYEKTPMFYKATIKPRMIPKTVFTVEDAIKVSLNQKGRLDLDFMTEIYRKPDNSQVTKDEMIEALGDRIYQDPAECLGEPYSGWKLAEEYLSGYVKDKLTEAILAAEDEPERFERNVTALKAVQPDMIKPEEINFSLGTTWIPTEVYKRFMFDTLQTMPYNRMGDAKIDIEFSKYSGAYFIANKGREKESVAASQTYGTSRISGYEILETTLNLRSVEVRDRVDYMDPHTGEDKVKYVLNRNETILAREKQAQLKAQFETWLFAKPERAAQLTKLYNDRFNNIRPRVYHGDDLELPDMNEEMTLRSHQRDVVAMGIYSDGNLLMAHEVGAGKTFAAIALTYELKRLGKVNKPLIAVPNHLLGQWADDFMRLYPQANILVAEKKDFERRNRRRFASRIATGDFDAVIMAHSSLELIGLSRERQLAAMRTEIEAISEAIDYEKARSGKGWSLKQMQIFRSNMQSRYDKLFNADKKDDVISFEELGVDCLVVDEAHAYKNNFSYTKMRNVAGISGQSSQRAMDMYQKTQYINEIGNGKGVIYLTGTPVSNSMAELYVMQKTLQPKALEERGLLMFDAWASTFGKVETSLEIKPEGNGYQMKNRFSKFHNIPELMSMLNMVADIKTSEMLDLPVPKLKTGGDQVIKTKITPEQKQMILEMGERAENIRSGTVDSSEDNFLKLTHEARLLAVDPRAIDPSLPDDPDTKLNVCANNVAKIYHETTGQKSTQLIFCDQGTPKADGSFNFYETTRQSLIAKGVKPEEIAFIHDAKSDTQRDELFEKVRNGEIRILMGSTDKMGTGMNVQKKLIALHHLDVPWRPSDLIQRNGRVLRQGNENEEVSIYNYITENTFDAYLWQILEQKQRYISQIMTGRSALRSCEDIDDTVLQYAEFKALATSDPRIKEKMETDNEISRLTVLKSAWQTKKNELHQKVVSHYPVQIAQAEKRVDGIEKDVQTFRANRPGEFAMVLNGKVHSERTKAAEHLRVLFRKVGRETGSRVEIGTYAGFPLQLVRLWNDCLSIQLRGNVVYTTEAGESELGNITRIERLAERIDSMKTESEQALLNLKQQFDAAKVEMEIPFADEGRLSDLHKRKVELDLNLEFKGGADVMGSDKSETEAIIDNSEECSLEQVLYQKFCVFGAPIFQGAYYMCFETKHFDKLVLEDIGEGEYSIAHYYERNGDAMRAPEVTFQVDQENKAIYPTSFLQDDMGIFYEVEDAHEEQISDLRAFMSEWFSNIQLNGFELTEIKHFEQEVDVER